MTIELTETQHQAVLNGEPVRVSDPRLGRDVVLVPADVFERLHAQLDEEENDGAWMAGIAREWATELSDAREDIYTLEDGEPVDESR